MAMFAPVFARGKGTQRTVSSYAIGTSSTVVTLSAAASPMAVGQHLFVSNADGTAVEYLGKIRAVSGSQVTASLVAQGARAAGALAWTPAAVWQAATVPSAVYEPSYVSGVETLETAGPALLHTRAAEAKAYLGIAWRNAERGVLMRTAA
jgi:hypothetical protein